MESLTRKAGGMIGPEVGDILRKARVEKGFTQEQFGKILGVSKTYVGMVERGNVNANAPKLYDVFKQLGYT